MVDICGDSEANANDTCRLGKYLYIFIWFCVFV